MRKIREILRLHFGNQLGYREVATSCQMSTSTVYDYVLRAKAAKLGWPLPMELDSDEKLSALLFRDVPGPARKYPEPDFPHIHLELKKKHVTLQLLWQEYREQFQDGYEYSRFTELYGRWSKTISVTMRQHHEPGKKLFLDFSGDGLDVIDRLTGECKRAKLFVAVLGASNLTYVRAVFDESLPTWIGCHVHALEYMGGVAEIWVPDNLKSGVSKADYYDPDINQTYAELARHYGAAVIPARPYKPRDKAKVEQGVLLAERWILACLRNRTFFSLEELNEAVKILVEKLNNRLMKKMKKSRRQLFEEVERSALRPLPEKSYEMAEWKQPRANIDYHVEFDDHFYSVHYTLVGQQVDLRATDATVEILVGGVRLVSYARSYEKYKFTTTPEHMPKSHRAHAEWTPSRIIGWAKTVGPSTAGFAEEIMRRRTHPEWGFRACMGLIRLKDKYPVERIERACERAIKHRAYSYRSVVAILKNNLDRQPLIEEPQGTLPLHGNIRGRDYYH